MKTPLRYAGGKTRAIKIITPYVEKYDKIISPFIGGGSLEVYWASQLKKEVIGYDIFDTLVNFWNVLLEQPNDLYNELIKIKPNDEEFRRIKEILLRLDKTQEMLKDWKTDHYKREDIIKLDNLTLAAYYYFNHNTSYGPGFLGFSSSVYCKEDTWIKQTNKIKDFKCENLSVFNKTFDESIKLHNKDFLYLDPPYYLGGDNNKMYKGLYPIGNIDVHHSGFDHELLRDLLLKHEGDFVLSYNNCEVINEWYKDFEIVYPKWAYGFGNGNKNIGDTRRKKNNKMTKDSHEVLIIKR